MFVEERCGFSINIGENVDCMFAVGGLIFEKIMMQTVCFT